MSTFEFVFRIVLIAWCAVVAVALISNPRNVAVRYFEWGRRHMKVGRLRLGLFSIPDPTLFRAVGVAIALLLVILDLATF